MKDVVLDLDEFISNGNSFVSIQKNKAIQTFNYPNIYKKVKNIILDLKKKPNTIITLDNIQYTFNGSDFHTFFLKYRDGQFQIVWEKIICLNQLDNYKEFLIDHNEKFYWDILRSITYMNMCGYEHNDVSIDNIGIRNGNFVLFDYDMSKKSKDLFTGDLYKLFKSIKFHLGEKHIQFWSILEYVFLIKKKHGFIDTKKTLIYLDNLKIY